MLLRTVLTEVERDVNDTNRSWAQAAVLASMRPVPVRCEMHRRRGRSLEMSAA